MLSVVALLLAHDMWIEPSSFRAAEQSVAIRLLVGENLLGDPLPRNSRLIEQFVVVDAFGERRDLPGREGMDPAGFFQTPRAQVVGYFSKPSTVELPAEKFNDYLVQEGLDKSIAPRKAGTMVKEQFSRCAKTLLDGFNDRVLGFPVELIAEARNGAFSVRLMQGSRPLANTQVVAMNRMHPELKQVVRTGRDGRVTLKLGAPGMWMIKAVHMEPVGTGADFHSYWASLTFEKR